MITTGSDSDNDDEDQPVLDTINVIHDGGVNRIRVCNSRPIKVLLHILKYFKYKMTSDINQ